MCSWISPECVRPHDGLSLRAREHVHAGELLPALREDHGAHEPITGSGLITLRHRRALLMRSNSASAVTVGPLPDCLFVC